MGSVVRRRVLAGGAAVLSILGSRPIAAATALTPGQAEGPFYPRADHLGQDLDNDLVQIEGAVQAAGGEIFHLSGTVVGQDGAPIADALVEIWQCDVNGRYIHRRDWSLYRDRDPNFQGYGKTATDTAGRYSFRTIKPVPYPGRTPHIHVKAHDPRDGSVLTTQMYLAGDPQNAADTLFRYLSKDEQAAVSVALSKRDDGSVEGDFRIVL